MDRIKESFDSLPIAICFFDENGIVRLINHSMLHVANALRHDGIQTLDELHGALLSPPVHVCCLDAQLRTYLFYGKSVLRFAEAEITTKYGKRYTQVTAADVTELIEKQDELEDENKKLADANSRLRRMIEQMPEVIRKEETLAMKMRIHDDIGHSILSARKVLIHGADLKEIQDSARIWERTIATLYRSAGINAQRDPLEGAKARAAEMGVKIITAGILPKTHSARELTAIAIRECAANCARHAGGTELYLRCWSGSGYANMIITNNGAPPKRNITEGGGLSMLRMHVEGEDGKMDIQSRPCFKLTLSLPEKEDIKHAGNDS